MTHQIQIVIIMTLLLLHLTYTTTAAASCSDNVNRFTCPNCGGIFVSDCLQCDGYFNTDQNESMCFNRKLFNTQSDDTHDNHYPFLLNDIFGAIIWFCAAGVATACGVGGGGIYVPLGIILLRFSSKPASGLSQASIFGASLGGLLLNIRNQHPDTKIRDTIGQRDEDGKVIPYDKDKTKGEIEASEAEYLNAGGGEKEGEEERKFYTRPVIDYDMALFLAPMEMAGAVLGVLIQRIMPNWLFLTLAGIVLGLTSYKTYEKFFAAFKKDKQIRSERRAREEEEEELEKQQKEDTSEIMIDATDSDEMEPSQQQQEANPALDVKSNTEIVDTEEKLRLRRQYLEEDARQYPVEKIVYLGILWVGLAIITFLKGGKGVDSVVGITCKSAWYYVLIALQFLWTIGFAIIFGLRAVKRREARSLVNYPFHENDVLWDRKGLNFYAGVTFGAGIIAGLIGIGGGMVLGPLMLVMGIHPRVSSATTATMVVLTSSSVAVMFVTSGLVPWQYAVFFFCICMCGAYVGKRYIDDYVKRTGMASILIGILATIIALATVGCFIIVLLNLSKNDWCFDWFKPFCDEKDNGDVECAARRLFAEVMRERLQLL